MLPGDISSDSPVVADAAALQRPELPGDAREKQETRAAPAECDMASARADSRSAARAVSSAPLRCGDQRDRRAGAPHDQ